MDIALKLFQIGFYITGSIIAILTFVKAKNGLLNSVNTEYQKRVMDRLARLSDEIYAEFDPASDKYWVKGDPVKEVVDKLHEKIIPYKHEILTSKEIFPGTPMPKSFDELSSFLNKLKSDPFVPKDIREKVVELLMNRTNTMFCVYMDELNSYKEGLKNGKYWDNMNENYAWIHNRINQRLYDNGCGISQVEEAAHDVRLAIQAHMEKFDPLRN